MKKQWLVLLGLPCVLLATQPSWSQEQTAENSADIRNKVEEARNQERGVLEQLHEIDRQLQNYRREFRDLETKEEELDAIKLRHEDELASANAVINRYREHVRRRVRALYRLHRQGLARIIFGGENPSSIRRRSAYLWAVVSGDMTRLREHRTRVEAKKTAAAAIQADVAALDALRAELQLKQAELRDERARRLSLLEDIRSKRTTALRALSEMADVRQSLKDRLAGQAMATSPSNPQSFRASFGSLPWPTTGTLKRGFGYYTDPLTGQTVNNKGIDIAADYGTPIRAVYGGEVELADFIPGYGQTIAVRHGNYTSVYAHANGLRVRKGQSVAAGDVLGLVGNTGLTDGAGYLLTFEVRYNGTPQDPVPWLSPR